MRQLFPLAIVQVADFVYCVIGAPFAFSSGVHFGENDVNIKKIGLAVSMLPLSNLALAESLPLIEVEADINNDAATAVLTDATTTAATPADGGEWLLQIPGVSGIKMGAKGVDPVIRGQKYNQLNVLLDGAFVYGGCSNRMDPPTAWASAAGYDSVTVFKGVQSLIYGSGGSGGTVLFERAVPDFAAGEKLKGRIGGGYRSNGEVRDGFADVASGSADAFARGIISASEAKPYKDGDGNEIHSGYKSRTGALSLGARTAAGSLFRFDTDVTRGRDTLYAGAPMDAPVEDGNLYKLGMDTPTAGAFENIKAEVYLSDIYHEMDNYSLRPAGMMWMRVDSDSDTSGGRLLGDLAMGEGILTLGFDVQNVARDSTRYMSSTASYPVASQSFLWPGTQIDQSGVFAEYNGESGKASRYTASLRYDRVEAEASKATQIPNMGMSPDMLYNTYYGTTARKQTENNLGALYRMEHDVARDMTLFWGLSRTVRTADATERYMAANNSMTALRWIGNPDLEPEVHRQLDVGMNRQWKKTHLSLSVYYDDVRDYILRDRAHGQAGILQTDNASIYRNVDAELYGFELEAGREWSRHWHSRFTLAFVHATNTTDKRPIAQTPPLEGTVSLEYRQLAWLAGMELRATDRQTRVEDDLNVDSGLDAGPTPGFAVWNLYASRSFGQDVEVKFGVDNVLDKTYAEHLNKPNAFDPGANQINEPGRSVWARLRVVL